MPAPPPVACGIRSHSCEHWGCEIITSWSECNAGLDKVANKNMPSAQLSPTGSETYPLGCSYTYSVDSFTHFVEGTASKDLCGKSGQASRHYSCICNCPGTCPSNTVWGGKCEHGELPEEKFRYEENHCSSCTPGFARRIDKDHVPMYWCKPCADLDPKFKPVKEFGPSGCNVVSCNPGHKREKVGSFQSTTYECVVDPDYKPPTTTKKEDTTMKGATTKKVVTTKKPTSTPKYCGYTTGCTTDGCNVIISGTKCLAAYEKVYTNKDKKTKIDSMTPATNTAPRGCSVKPNTDSLVWTTKSSTKLCNKLNPCLCECAQNKVCPAFVMSAGSTHTIFSAGAMLAVGVSLAQL